MSTAPSPILPCATRPSTPRRPRRSGANASLTAVEVRPSPLSGVRRIVEVIFSFTNRQTEVTEKFFTRVDVTEEFPFLVTKMSPYYDR
jgi:PatG C-terminal